MSGTLLAEPPLAVEKSEAERVRATDLDYFAMGAERAQLAGADFAWMPGLTDLPAGAVVPRIHPEAVRSLGSAWLNEVEDAFRTVSAPRARIYTDDDDPSVASVLRLAGYEPRVELLLAGCLAPPLIPMRLLAVHSEADWADKLRFHEETPERPDGYTASAARWVEMERRKCSAGMETFLAEHEGEIVGAVGLVHGEGVLRMKNVVIHAHHRRRHFGGSMLAHLAKYGLSIGYRRQCIFGVLGTAGERLYRSMGLEPVGACTEWTKNLQGGDGNGNTGR